MDYTALANAIKTTLEADAWLGNVANVATIEDFDREFSLQGEDGAPFYKDSELPAIAINPDDDGNDQDIETVGEIRENVTVEIKVFSVNSSPSSGRLNQRTLIENIERVLNAQKTSAADLGIDAFIPRVSSGSIGRNKKKENYIFSTAINFNVILTTTY